MHEEVFHVQLGPHQERRVDLEVNRVADRLAVHLRDEDAELRRVPRQVFEEALLARRVGWRQLFVGGEAVDERE